MNAYQILKERNFIYQITDEKQVPELLNAEGSTFYVGFDPTADSLHIGHLLPIMAMRILQKNGHFPIALVGGATAQVGDPSGKTQMRQMLSKEQIVANAQSLQKQLSAFLDFKNEPIARIVNNIDWFENITYIDFLRDVGKYFSVNKMLTAESVKMRLEKGLSFIEFNYMLLQAYDFAVLMDKYKCLFQFGGQDQWGNIVAGTDLARRINKRQGFAATFPLLMNSKGEKFGKTVAGAIWLDEGKTSVFDYYQFWRNSEDSEIEKLFAYFTDLPIREIKELAALPSPQINRAKEILAFEATKMVHGKEKATKAYLTASGKFGYADKECKIKTSSDILTINTDKLSLDLPTYTLDKNILPEGIWVIKLFCDCGLCKSNGDARRSLKSGALYINDERITDMNYNISKKDLSKNEIILRMGKKNYKRIVSA